MYRTIIHQQRRSVTHNLLALGVVAFSLAACLGAERSAAPQWPAFLGADATPVESDRVPQTWSPEKNIAWTMPLPGYGQSSPVVFGDQVYVSSVEGANKETLHLLAFDRHTGKQLWDQTHQSTHPEKNSLYISRAAPTPVLDEKGIYAYFESGDVIAVDHAGKSLWSMSLTKEFGAPTNEFGLSGSPVQTEDRIAILIDDPGKSYIAALSKKDGTVLWKTDREARTSWSSPAIVEFEGKKQIVCSSAGSVDGYDPQTGKLLWSYSEVGGNTATTPLPVGPGRFAVAASPGRTGENAELSRKSNGVMTVRKTGETWTPEFLWTNEKPTPSWGSPVVHNGLAYWINRVGVVYCLDAETGELLYNKRINDSPWATPVGVGEHLYIFGKKGVTTVLSAGKEFEIVAENTLWSEDAPPTNHLPSLEGESEERKRAAAMFSQPTVYGVAIVEDQILLRTGSQLFCVQAKGK